MKGLLATTAIVALSATGAFATTFEGSFTVSGDAFTDPGLVINVDPDYGTGSFDLDVGESITFDLFTIWTDETFVNFDDTIPQSIDVAFNLTSPEADGVLDGGSRGFGGIVQFGAVAWDNPLVLEFGNGGEIEFSLSNETFNWGLFGLGEGEKYGATVQLTAYYTVAPVPLPAAGGLLIAGIGGLAALRRRRKAA